MTIAAVDKLKQHILDLCERHEIRIEWRRDHRGGWAACELGLVSIPPIGQGTGTDRRPIRGSSAAIGGPSGPRARARVALGKKILAGPITKLRASR